MDPIFLDSETTGLSPSDRMVELAIIDDDANVLVNTLLNPGMPIPADAQAVHGISDDTVTDAPTLRQIESEVVRAVDGRHVVIYNAKYDLQFLTRTIRKAMGKVTCCMERFAPAYGDWDARHRNYRWKSLQVAADHIAYNWEGDPHRALTDALACRAVWHWLEEHG